MRWLDLRSPSLSGSSKRRNLFYKLNLFALTLSIVAFSALAQRCYAQSSYTSEDPSRHIQWWLENYRLASDKEPHIRRAYEIFESVFDVADKPTSVKPSLYIFSDLKGLCALSLPNGPIVISQDVIDFCNRDKGYADSRLAFVLAHEISHQVNGDWWHYNFFVATKILEETGNSAIRDSLLSIALKTDQRKAKELRADNYAILYSTLAGFQAVPMVSQDDNFIKQWIIEARPGTEEKEYPTPEERIAGIRAGLAPIVDNLELFDIGVKFYQIGKYSEAIEAFKGFTTYFPSREVLNNLGLSYYQEAVRFCDSKTLFKKSIQVDPVSRASEAAAALREGISRRGVIASYRKLFLRNLDRAIENFEEAVQRDPRYKVAYNNLGCALDFKDPYAAVGQLNNALQMDPNYKEAYNNRAISLFKIGKVKEAVADLIKASTLEPGYPDPHYNLALIYQEIKDTAKAEKEWEEYLKIDHHSFWARQVREYLGIQSRKKVADISPDQVERIGEIGISDLDSGVELKGYEQDTFITERRKIVVRSFADKGFKLIVSRKAGNIFEEGCENIIVAEKNYDGVSTLGVRIGAPLEELKRKYGFPDYIGETTIGQTWVYPDRGIAFDVVEGEVASWYVFKPE